MKCNGDYGSSPSSNEETDWEWAEDEHESTSSSQDKDRDWEGCDDKCEDKKRDCFGVRYIHDIFNLFFGTKLDCVIWVSCSLFITHIIIA